MSIIDLVKRAQQGDEEAYIMLFQQFERDIYRIAFVYLKNPEDALDVVQETAYRSYKSITQLRKPNYFKTWLIRIAISNSIDLLRQRKKVVQSVTDINEHMSIGGAKDTTLSLFLWELIDSLDEDEKSVIILRFYYDYTIKEVTKILEIPLGTGKTILYRALNKLRKLTEEGNVNEN